MEGGGEALGGPGVELPLSGRLMDGMPRGGRAAARENRLGLIVLGKKKKSFSEKFSPANKQVRVQDRHRKVGQWELVTLNPSLLI